MESARLESEELRTRLEADLSRVRAEADEKVTNLEKRLEAALGRFIKMVPLNKSPRHFNRIFHHNAGHIICQKFQISGDKLEVMMSLRDEVEQEYADRMAELRDMYRVEMDAQSETFAADKKKMQVLENSLQVNCSQNYE